jgi:hypothetical protein
MMERTEASDVANPDHAERRFQRGWLSNQPASV